MPKIIDNMQAGYRRKKYQWQFTFGALIIAATLTITLTFTTTIPFYLGWLGAISIITFIYFGWDKAKARNNSDVRIPEITLHLLNLAGGFVGGLLGMQLFRHKTDLSKHLIFPIIIVVGLLIHAAVAWVLYTN